MEFWIIASVAAASFQTIRFMLQKQLATGSLSASGATFARFVYSSPLLLIGLSLVFGLGLASFPDFGPHLWIYAAIGGASQICATVATVMLFQERHFAVGVTLTKIEVMLTALIGFVVLGDQISEAGIFALLIGVFGIIALSANPESLLKSGALSPRTAILGLLAGSLFAVSAVLYRGATLEVASSSALLRGAFTLAVATSIQTLLMLGWLFLRDRAEIGRVMAAWRSAGLIGVFSLLGSWGWFTAFSLQNAAYVKAVGQIEILMSLGIASFVFKERLSKREKVGIVLVTASILALILFV